MNNDKSGVCPHLNGVTDPNLFWVDLYKRSRYCYWFSIDLKDFVGNNLMSWSDASFHCHRRNGTLVSIHSPHELMLLRSKLFQPESSYNTWIGLYKDPNGMLSREKQNTLLIVIIKVTTFGKTGRPSNTLIGIRMRK